jgi:alpha-glucosidase/oligosaccharide 4-alpha-D-glucosyltransferase
MRPILFEEPENPKALTMSNEYFWGNDFLVMPVIQPAVKELEIYIPKSSNWFDFYTDEKYDAGTIRHVDIFPDRIPVFVRAGAFIPMVKPYQNTVEYSTKNIDLHYYYDKSVRNSSGHFYDDDGMLPNAYEKGQYELMNFESTSNGNMLTLKINAEKGDGYLVPNRKMNIIIHNVKSKPSVTLIDRKSAKFTWNSQNKTVEIPVNWKKEMKKEIQIQL